MKGKINFSIISDAEGIFPQMSLLEEGLDRCGQKQNLNQMMDLICSGRVLFVVGGRDLVAKGFFTCFMNGEELVIWHGYIRPPDDITGITAAFEAINDVASMVFKAKRVVFHTTRKGWQRVFAKFGFSQQVNPNGIFTYYKEVY
jgi:hypothetical protein